MSISFFVVVRFRYRAAEGFCGEGESARADNGPATAARFSVPGPCGCARCAASGVRTFGGEWFALCRNGKRCRSGRPAAAVPPVLQGPFSEVRTRGEHSFLLVCRMRRVVGTIPPARERWGERSFFGARSSYGVRKSYFCPTIPLRSEVLFRMKEALRRFPRSGRRRTERGKRAGGCGHGPSLCI